MLHQKILSQKGKSCQDEEMPHIQANKGKGVVIDVTEQIPITKKR